MAQQSREHPPLDEQSPGVRTHLELMQGVIERMATNSRSCKVWCVTLAAAVLVLVARTGEAQHALIALVPTALFLVLDSYYLASDEAFIAFREHAARVDGRQAAGDNRKGLLAQCVWALRRAGSSYRGSERRRPPDPSSARRAIVLMVWLIAGPALMLAACGGNPIEDAPPEPVQTTTPPDPTADADKVFRAMVTAWFLPSDFEEARELALLACWLLHEDATVPQVVSVIEIVAEAPQLVDDAQLVMRAAVAAFCPDQAFKLRPAIDA